MNVFGFVLVSLAVFIALAMTRAKLTMWAGGLAALAAVWMLYKGLHGALGPLEAAAALLPAVILGLLTVTGFRRAVLINPAMSMVKRILPPVSDTEAQALEAGTIGFDAELFSGTPDWSKLRRVQAIRLAADERAFLDGPTEELCQMAKDWEIRHAERRIPDAIWTFVRDRGFLGMLISKEHGGLGFSPQAQSLIIGKVSSRSPDVCTVVMVPNSLGPGELIEKYGTPAQKEHFLPRLAKGIEIPCFGLTGPTSGSDAANMRDIGMVTKGMHEGREVLGIRVNWEKRYITLGPEATLLGLAFQLFDPDKLIGATEDVGITVALIPTQYPGVRIGRRHLPSGSAFPNGPNWGEDVFIPMDFVIGGQAMAGHGWRMLMECLSAGRSISLPSSSAAGAKMMLRVTGAYARIRRQFGLSIARMEGIEEPLTLLVEHAYVLEAARATTAAMVSAGERPSVLGAILKYQSTERMRACVNAAMDVHGGRGICDGPANYLQAAYQMVPVAITVEGANILTRSLITFAQGALRSHPFLIKEMQAAQNPDRAKGLDTFEQAFMGHVSFSLANMAASLVHNLTGGWFAQAPAGTGEMARWYRQLSRGSRNFAFVADLTVAILGGGLKTKQKLTGRMADALSELYLLSCTLKRFEDDGRLATDAVFVELAARNGLARFQRALGGAIDNFPNAPVRWLMQLVCFPLGRRFKPASDALGRKAVALVIEPGEVRDRLTRDIFISKDPNDATGILEYTLPKVVAAEETVRKVERAVRKGEIKRYHGNDWLADAEAKGIVTAAECAMLREVEDLTARVIAVDHFDPRELAPNYRVISNTTTVPSTMAAE